MYKDVTNDPTPNDEQVKAIIKKEQGLEATFNLLSQYSVSNF